MNRQRRFLIVAIDNNMAQQRNQLLYMRATESFSLQKETRNTLVVGTTHGDEAHKRFRELRVVACWEIS